MQKIVFFRTAWMEHYGGDLDREKLTSDVSWIKDHGYCYEMFNFKSDKDEFLGFVEPKGSIHIDRLGANPNDEFIENVTVIWVAPKTTGGIYVVGWYLNATVFRKPHTPPPDSQRAFNGNLISYNVRAKVKDCVLLKPEERQIVIPTKKGGIGQSNIWYADDKANPAHQKKREEVLAYINKYRDEHWGKCECGAGMLVTQFQEGKAGKCSKCGKLVAVMGGKVVVADTIMVRKEDENAEKEPANERGQSRRSRHTRDEIFREMHQAIVGVHHDAASGSGFIIDDKGLIATNRHVVKGYSEVQIKLHDGAVHPAKILKYYRHIDLAFLKMPIKTKYYIPVDENAQVQVGLGVCAVGHPLGCEWVMTGGIVSKVDELIDDIPFIITDASIEHGNSGGPLINEYCELIGMNTMGLTQAKAMNFAIPVKLIWEKLSSIRDKVDYLESNHFCHTCHNTSHGTTFCDHCGVRIGDGSITKGIDRFAVNCIACQNSFDEEASVCPNCSEPIRQRKVNDR